MKIMSSKSVCYDVILADVGSGPPALGGYHRACATKCVSTRPMPSWPSASMSCSGGVPANAGCASRRNAQALAGWGWRILQDAGHAH